MTSFPKDQSLSNFHLAHEKKAMSPLLLCRETVLLLFSHVTSQRTTVLRCWVKFVNYIKIS